jgi:uncharacterized protein (DUF486 family)
MNRLWITLNVIALTIFGAFSVFCLVVLVMHHRWDWDYMIALYSSVFLTYAAYRSLRRRLAKG